MSREDVTIMAHRRADWGSVTKVSPGVWRIRYWADGPDGYRRRSKTVRGTRRDAGDALAALRLDHSADAPCPTVGQCWDRWYAPALDAALAEGSKAPNTVRGYRNAYDVHIAPRWSGVPVDAVRPLDVQRWVSSMPRRTAVVALSVAKRTCSYAVRYEVSDRNPFDIDYDLPPSNRDDGTVWSTAELGMVFRAVSTALPHLVPAFILCACGSCRVGEAWGVSADDVRLEYVDSIPVASAPIVRQVTQDMRVSERLKTPQSRRTVVVPGKPAIVLADAAEKCAGTYLMDDGAGRLVQRSQLNRPWRTVVASSGVRYRPFATLRNSWRTFMAADLSVDTEMLEKMMGHLGDSVSQRHYFRPGADAFARALADAYKRVPYAEEW